MCVNLAPLKLFSLKINLSASLCISLQEPKSSNGCAPVWPEVHHWSRALSKACLLVFHKRTLHFPNYTDPEIQALTRLSRERGVLKGCFTSRSVGWIQCENSKLVKSTWSSIQRFYFLYFRVKWEKRAGLDLIHCEMKSRLFITEWNQTWMQVRNWMCATSSPLKYCHVWGCFLTGMWRLEARFIFENISMHLNSNTYFINAAYLPLFALNQCIGH